MAAMTVNRPSHGAKPRLRPAHETTPPARASATRKSRSTPEPGELPSRKALTARLEAQRAQLLRAMVEVNLARRMIQEHVAEPPQGDVLPLLPERHELYRQQVLEALRDAAESLATAYPMLESIARALDASQMLKGQQPGRPQSSPAKRAASR